MKKLLFILFLASCAKEEQKEPTCVTCQLVVDQYGGGMDATYIEQSKEICDDSWKELDGKVTQTGSTTSHGNTVYIDKQWHCK